MASREDVEVLLKRLADFAKDIGLEIGGCGCCCSPYGQIGGEEFDELDVKPGQVRARFSPNLGNLSVGFEEDPFDAP